MTPTVVKERKPWAPRRYTSREMIIADIDKSQKRANKLKSRIDQILGAIEMLDPEFHFVQIKRLNVEVDDLQAMRERILNTRMLRLKNTLAAFDTPTFDGSARDVCLQRV